MNIVNIMNFVRGCDPRAPELDLVLPIRRELELCNAHGFPNTCLLQYDAMLREDIVTCVKSNGQNTEFGIWIELCRTLCESVGIPWQGREGWDWDWYVNPDLLPAYTQEERRRLIDEIMRLFRETFGNYPKSAASWMLDAYSIEYMQKEYNVKAFGICREQYGVDAYSLTGGYYNQGYYPSKYNNLCPASTKKNQINAPVFRLLGPDPIFNYGRSDTYPERGSEPHTIEPSWSDGSDPIMIQWYFDSYFNRDSLAFSYIQLGQENSFGNDMIEESFSMQLDILQEYVDRGECTLMKMGESGEWFIRSFERTPATAIGAKMTDSPSLKESQWYNCVNYRVNFVSEGEQFYIRDIYKFNESFIETSYDEAYKHAFLAYENLPVMNGFLWSLPNKRAGIYFEDSYLGMKAHGEGDSLIIEAAFDKGITVITLTETEIRIRTKQSLQFVAAPCCGVEIEQNRLRYRRNSLAYSVGVTGFCSQDGLIMPNNGEIVFSMCD